MFLFLMQSPFTKPRVVRFVDVVRIEGKEASSLKLSVSGPTINNPQQRGKTATASSSSPPSSPMEPEIGTTSSSSTSQYPALAQRRPDGRHTSSPPTKTTLVCGTTRTVPSQLVPRESRRHRHRRCRHFLRRCYRTHPPPRSSPHRHTMPTTHPLTSGQRFLGRLVRP